MHFFSAQQYRIFSPATAALLLCSLIFLSLSVPSVAEILSEESEENAAVVPVLETVVVTGAANDDVSGKTVYSEEMLSVLPTGDGNIEDLLKFMPGVQASDSSNTSFRGGEIISPLLSISGGKPYQNYFQIDGMGNNSLIDPIEDNPSKIDRLPGYPEEIFLNSHLVKEITVYDNNIPVRFGGFTGGVVDVKTIDPASIPGGAVRYNTTRDDWTRFHIDPSDQTDFDQSATYFRQPQFTKHEGGFDLSLPITPSSGLLLSYQFVYSEIPLVFFDSKQNQERFNQNFLLKFVSKPNATDKITLQAIYSPYKASYFIKDTLNSDFTLKGGGTSLLAAYETAAAGGVLDLRVGFRRSENSRTAPKDYFLWTESKEGGFGNLEIQQDSYEFNLDWLSSTMMSGDAAHKLNTGMQWLYTSGSYDRDETSYAYRTSVPIIPPDPFADCVSDPIACIPGDQYLSRRSVYPASHSRAKLNHAALYLEDLVSLGRLELRPGVRFSYDDLMENIDTAPRLAGSYDLFGNGRSKVIAGWNRYYGDTLLTYKLREGIALSETQSRSTVIDNNVEWTTTSLVLASDQFSKLKTPFTDETVVGFDQLLWGGTTGFRYVRRDGEDEFARERDAAVSGEVRYSRLNNNGKSHYESYRLSWERHWSAQFLSMNIAYASSTSTHDDYDNILMMDDLNEQIWYDGELLDADELPRNDFNRRWVASLLYSVAMDYGFRFTNTTNFRSGYENIVKSSDPPITIDGTDYSIYYKEKRPSSTIFDWRIDWIPPAFPEQALTVTLEIFNLLNKRTYVGASTDEYELGRQFWAGVEYTF